MQRSFVFNSALKLLVPAAFAIAFVGFAQEPGSAPAGKDKAKAKAAPDAPENHRPGLFMREAWNHTGTPEHALSQSSVASPNLELHMYGDKPAPDPNFGGMWENKRPQPLDDPAHIFTGTCKTPCAATFRDKDNFADLSGLAKIAWRVKYQGFHNLRPVLKLADGTYLVGDLTDVGYTVDWHVKEFSMADLRWRVLEMEPYIMTSTKKSNWITNPDLSKVDEIGFVDLMPGSGHGNGGFSDLAWMEVYGNPVKR